MFQRKLSTDIMRMDSMMANLISNKEKLSKMFNHAETGKTTSIAQFDFDVSEYTEEDANADKKLEAMKIQNSTRNLTQGQAKGKARAKAAKVARKKSRRR